MQKSRKVTINARRGTIHGNRNTTTRFTERPYNGKEVNKEPLEFCKSTKAPFKDDVEAFKVNWRGCYNLKFLTYRVLNL